MACEGEEESWEEDWMEWILKDLDWLFTFPEFELELELDWFWLEFDWLDPLKLEKKPPPLPPDFSVQMRAALGVNCEKEISKFLN